MEAVSTLNIFLPDFTTNMLLWFLLGPAQTFLFAVQVDDVHLHKPFAWILTTLKSTFVKVYPTFPIKLFLEIIIFLNLHEDVIGFPIADN